MDEKKLCDRIAHLEFENDQLNAELEYVDGLLRSVGFTDGLVSLKSAAVELASYEEMQERLFEDGLPGEPPGLDW